ncbi:hypothetical protein [Streptomyces sp. NPDC059071]
MKKLLVAAAITLGVLGIATATAVADGPASQVRHSVAGDPACC